MTALELIDIYISFFEKRGHKRIPNAPLVPENDPTTLFTTAGMHPLVPYLLGQPHPLGKRLVGLQKCLRTDDIDEVGDKVHHTFFEMLGNWSLGDYWKKEAIEYSYEFLTSKEWLGIDKDRIAISVFAGGNDAPFDQESYDAWIDLGISDTRIAKLPKNNNWWGPVGKTGPCGPDTEMFVWASQGKAPETFDPNNPEWFEVWNDVFMEYNKKEDGTFEALKQRNVDTGMGLERILAVLNGVDDDYQTELFRPAIKKLENLTNQKYEGELTKFRIITDHLRAAVSIITEGIEPSNKERGYVLRRMIRRAIIQLDQLDVKSLDQTTNQIADKFIEIILPIYPELQNSQERVLETIRNEVAKFQTTLNSGINRALRDLEELQKATRFISENRFVKNISLLFTKSGVISTYLDPYQKSLLDKLVDIGKHSGLIDSALLSDRDKEHIQISKADSKRMQEILDYFKNHRMILNSTWVFRFTSTYGVPVEILEELAKENNIDVDTSELEKLQKEHQRLSRASASKKFAGGLADQSLETIKGHTATHLLHQALRDVLGNSVHQTGSNITVERVRFDFNYDKKLTDEEIKKVEDIVNEKIKQNLAVSFKIMSVEQAKEQGAIGLFEEKYRDKVKVYFIGDYSKEICGGPHVKFTGRLKRFKIIRQETIGRGQRRIYAVLENPSGEGQD